MQPEPAVKMLDMFRFGRLRGLQVLSVLAAQAEGHGNLEGAGVRLQKTEGGWYSIFLPAYRGRDNTAARQAFHGSLVSAIQEVAGPAAVGRSAQQAAPVDTTGMVGAWAGLAILASDTATGAPFEELPDDLLLITPRSVDTQAISAVMRQGRDAKLLASGDDNLAILVDDAPERYGTVADMLGRGDLPDGLVALRPWVAGRARLWLPLDHAPPEPGALTALGRAWEAWQRDVGPDDVPPPDVACLQSPDGVTFRLEILPALRQAAPVTETVSPELDPIQPLVVTTLRYAASEEAARGLAQEILRNSDRIGYRVRLHPVPPHVSAGMDVEPLLEQIEDLRLRIAQIQALGAPQQRLLRFTDAQLPALVDALRRVPSKALTDGSLRYAAGHAQGRDEPAHYLLFDASQVHLRFAQSLWQSRTEDRPMSYWLEPFVAQAQMISPTQTRVFVPDRHMLSPSLAHFGGDVDGTLRLVLGALFVSLGPLASDRARKPYFIFTRPPRAKDTIEVEVVDGDSFAPVHQAIGWMNDYLEVRGANAVDREALRAVAQELYEGAYVETVRNDLAGDVEEATRQWDAALEKLRADAAALLDDHTEELGRVSERIAKAHVYLRNAEGELTALETLMEHAAAALQGRSEVSDQLTLWDRDIRAAAETFSEAMDRELDTGSERISAAENRLALLQERLKSLSRWRG